MSEYPSVLYQSSKHTPDTPSLREASDLSRSGWSSTLPIRRSGEVLWQSLIVCDLAGCAKYTKPKWLAREM